MNSEKSDKSLENDLGRNFNAGTFFLYVLPSMFAYVFNGVYTIADGAFIERFEGPYAIAAVNLFYPVLNLLLALGLMIGTGGAVALAALAGEKKYESANSLFSQLILLAGGLGVLLAVAGIVFSGRIMPLLGATDGNIAYFQQYYWILTAASSLLIFSSMFVPLFLGEGKTTVIAVLTVLGGLLNIGLDLLFMGVFGWGITGAAIATAIGYSVAPVYALWFYASSNQNGSIYRFRITRISMRKIFPVMYNGSSEMVSNLANGVTALIMNHLAYRYYKEVGVSVVSVFLYVQFLIMAIFMGMTSATEPVFAYHDGSGNIPMRKKIFRLSLLWTSVFSIFLFVITLLFHQQISALFFSPSDESSVGFYELACRCLLYAAPACLVVGFNIFASGLFTAFSNGTVSAILSVLRTFVILIACMYGMIAIMGPEGLWASWLASELLSLIVSILFIVLWRKKYKYF